MYLGRRHFLGAIAGSAASLFMPRDLAQAIAPQPEHLPAGADRSVLLSRALVALQQHHDRVASRDVIGIVDFSAPSRLPRFQLVDVAAGKVISDHLVAHGSGSDPGNSGWVQRLSNRPGSHASCSGAFLTGEIYNGKHGRSRRLQGLDMENSMASSRGIVIHAARYVAPDLAESQGRVGRSQGCFAVSADDIAHVLERLGPGRLLFAAR